MSAHAAGGGETPGEDGAAPGDWPDDHDDRLKRWMLALAPEERLAALQGYVDSVQELRDRRGSLARARTAGALRSPPRGPGRPSGASGRDYLAGWIAIPFFTATAD